MKRFERVAAAFALSVALCFSGLSVPVLAEEPLTTVPGKVYVFDDKNSYEFENAKDSDEAREDNTFGAFGIQGKIVNNMDMDGIPSYIVKDGETLEIHYNHQDKTQYEKEEDWHLVNDSTKKVNDKKLEGKVENGVILIQISPDGKNWTDKKVLLNAFEDEKERTEPIYETDTLEVNNGCYYRVIVAYETGRKTGDGALFLPDKYENQRHAEVYEFHTASERDNEALYNNSQSYNLGDKVRVKTHKGYTNPAIVSNDDLHYGWDLGQFKVTGFSRVTSDENGYPVFLKVPGDQITLWFRLEQDINKLNGDQKLSITNDKDGSDIDFETTDTVFGKGALMTRHIDYQNKKQEPVIYTNFLSGNAKKSANTKIDLFEEGDYEVALDYGITKAGAIGKQEYYRIYFPFVVRNGNCMVYPFDLKTGSELTNSSSTPNGFRLDLAKSRYLNINVKREMIQGKNYELKEDMRFNGPAKDGAEYTEEGIYTITVENRYTDQKTEKKIYVGKDEVLEKYVETGVPPKDIQAVFKNKLESGLKSYADSQVSDSAQKEVEK